MRICWLLQGLPVRLWAPIEVRRVIQTMGDVGPFCNWKLVMDSGSNVFGNKALLVRSRHTASEACQHCDCGSILLRDYEKYMRVVMAMVSVTVCSVVRCHCVQCLVVLF